MSFESVFGFSSYFLGCFSGREVKKKLVSKLMMRASSRKLKVAVVFGGRSGEHEVSLQSAASVMKNLDPQRFEVVPVKIDPKGRWHLGEQLLLEEGVKSLPLLRKWPEVDVVFPVMHGPLCEDGTIQGLFELAEIPFVGAGVLASAVGMDKDVAKRLVRDAGWSVVPYCVVRQADWQGAAMGPAAQMRVDLSEKISKELGYPVFIKPANLGSSVGVHKVKDPSELEPALADAFRYDSKVLVEQAVRAREIEVSVLENSSYGASPLVSIPGEIIPRHEFYSYEAKYLDENGATLMIPAQLKPEQVKEAQTLAAGVFTALECEGMGRVDLFLDQDSGRLYFNEINTIPGFTKISMYPKLWEASGISYRELLSRLIDLALARHQRKGVLCREFGE